MKKKKIVQFQHIFNIFTTQKHHTTQKRIYIIGFLRWKQEGHIEICCIFFLYFLPSTPDDDEALRIQALG